MIRHCCHMMVEKSPHRDGNSFSGGIFRSINLRDLSYCKEGEKVKRIETDFDVYTISWYLEITVSCRAILSDAMP